MSSAEPHSEERRSRYCFGGFTLDLESGLLSRGGEEIALRPKSFEVLAYLVDRHGRLVSRDELMRSVWRDVAVTDESVTKCIADIRKALDDDSQQLIRTVARRGYLFNIPVTTPIAGFPRQAGGAVAEPGPVRVPTSASHWILNRRNTAGAIALIALAVLAALLMHRTRPAKQDLTYTQITNFTDSAVSPALSPDGRMLAFLRSDNWFLSADQIYVKLLPNGEPVQITHDSRPKYGPVFSPDGSRIAYTVFPWSTYTVSSLGGEPTKLLSNSSGPTWLDERHILFSEVSTGQHMGLVTATENRSEYRKIYFPRDERGMVHLSYASPDRRWAIVLEMDPVWHPCRVVPLDGSSAGRRVGPQGRCTSAAWSPDGKWMYFGVEIDGNHHLWRQRFPTGEPEQITSGATEEDGIAVTPDGRSLITSIGLRQSAVWIHDGGGERPLFTEGYVTSQGPSGTAGTIPIFLRDGKSLFYLKRDLPESGAELWRSDLKSQTTEVVLRGMSILAYDVSNDGKEAVVTTQSSRKPTQLWLADLDRRSPPQLLASSGEDSPHFGPDGRILYRVSDGKNQYLEQMNRDGSARSKVVPYPVGNLLSISPDRRWIMAVTEPPGGGIGGTYAVPVAGGAPRRICSGCPAIWAPDGKYLYLGVQKGSRTSPGKTRVFPLLPGEMIPPLPPLGMPFKDDPNLFPGSRLVDGFAFSPGSDPSVFAYVKTTMRRNLFRIPLR